MSDEAPNTVKQCCARLYESDIVARLLGESFHPGGAALTRRLGVMAGLGPGSRVLDAASGRGTSALLLAREFGCSVLGIDLSRENVDRAAAEARALGLSDRVSFQVGDVERLAVDSASMDAVVCECAFCTFPDKATTAREFARVLKPGGRVGLSDITRTQKLPDELDDLVAWLACLADARSSEQYAAELEGAGFTDVATEPHDKALLEMIHDIRRRLFAAEVLSGLQKLDLPGIDMRAAGRMARQALTAVSERRLGYAIVCGTRMGGLLPSTGLESLDRLRRSRG